MGLWHRYVWLTAGLVTAIFGQSLPFELRFADLPAAQELIQADDDFMQAMTPFDRAVRMNSVTAVTADSFKTYLAAQVLPWTDSGKGRILSAFRLLDDSLRHYGRFPKNIILINTTGDDECGAPYTRQNAVFIPRALLENQNISLERMLIHELFHIMSRYARDLQDSLYRSIGFQRCSRIACPEVLINRKLTNPDAPFNDHFIVIEYQGSQVPMVPVLLAGQGFQPGRHQNVFEYLELKFMAVEQAGGQWNSQFENGSPRLIEVIDILSLFEKTGSNTTYIIHPDEILADNFMMMVLDEKNVPSPEIIAGMRRILKK